MDLYMSAGKITGRVTSVTLRSTSVRSFAGTLHVIANGMLQVTGNESRERGQGHRARERRLREDVERVQSQSSTSSSTSSGRTPT